MGLTWAALGYPVWAWNIGTPDRVCGIDRSQLYSDEGPPIGAVVAEPWPEAGRVLLRWLLRWS